MFVFVVGGSACGGAAAAAGSGACGDADGGACGGAGDGACSCAVAVPAAADDELVLEKNNTLCFLRGI